MSILFYDDSPVFGGHEVMSLLGLEAVLRGSSETVYFFAASKNEKLCSELSRIQKDFPQLHIEEISWHSSKLEALRNRIFRSRFKILVKRFRKISPKLLVAVQGNIEHSSLSLLAAKKAGIRSLSYIPVPHSHEEMGAKLGRIRDRFCSYLFQVPDVFLTITEEMAKILRRQGATAPIEIVYNGVDTDRFQKREEKLACEELQLPKDLVRLGMIGRIEFRQKQQHLLVEALANHPNLSTSCHLVFAGDGPDAGRLRELLDQHQLSGTILPWCDPSKLYSALSALILPSRYEGLPLVMLEALASGTAVLGSDRDGMKDLLPSSCRFSADKPESIAEILTQFISVGCPEPDPSLVRRVRETMSLSSFQEGFLSCVHKHCYLQC